MKALTSASGEFLCACAAARQTARALTTLYDEVLRPHDIEAAQFALLAMIDGHGECSQATLVERFDFDKSTMSRNLRLLERRKWLVFVAGSDGRERRVRLTALGGRRLAAAKPAWQHAQQRLRKAMKSQDWDAMLGGFQRVTTAAREARR
jgi:DNA-binding MarR family transcriptional regulator